MTRSRFVANPMRVRELSPPRLNLPRAFHSRLPSYEPTPLVDAPELAAQLGLDRVMVKDETHRLGQPSYEILGAAWAIYRAAIGRLGVRPRRWAGLDELVPQLEPLRPLRVVTVTDNHFGLAVAAAARLLGFDATIFLPESAASERTVALREAGAEVVAAGATYDDALARATVDTSPEDVIISDSSWAGFDEVPSWVTEGYVTLFEEAVDEVGGRDGPAGGPPPLDCVVVPLGTGALAAAAGGWFRTEAFGADLTLIGAEAEGAACFAESVAAHERMTAPDPAPTLMTSLARGRPSAIAFDVVAASFDGFVALSDADALAAVESLRRLGITADPAGAASLAVLVALSGHAVLHGVRTALVVCSEGPLVVGR